MKTKIPIVDVRSPSEYSKGHIPGSVSIPLFNDDERAKVGTAYNHQGQKEAIKLGLDLVGPKMRGFVEAAEELKSKQLGLYCWRGGMRSESMGWLLSQYGFSVSVLDGGYKSYRREVRDFFTQELSLVVVTGYTGSGKTEVLHALREQGEQIVDLEGLALHQGSSFGNQMSRSQPTSEQFQNNVLWEFKKLNPQKRIWIEDESICIGQVTLPESLFELMNRSPHLLMEVEKSERVKKLVRSYGSLDSKKLIAATKEISKKLGLKETGSAIHRIESGNLDDAADVILTYYDRQYRKSIGKKSDLIRYVKEVKINEPIKIAESIIKEYEYQVNRA